MKMLKNLFVNFVFIILGMGISFPCFADTLHGLILDVNSPQLRLHLLKNNKIYNINPSNMNLKRDLHKLAEGDLVVGQGLVIDDKNEVQLSSIDYVGLKQILGLWRTKSWDIFDFQNFWNLKLCENPSDARNPFCNPRTFSYRIAPDSGNNWSIFLSENDKIAVGSLQIEESDHIVLTIYDVSSGKVVQRIDLSLLQSRKP